MSHEKIQFKSYYLSQKNIGVKSWFEANVICQSFGMEFLSLDTKDEHDKFVKLINGKLDIFDGLGKYTYVGGMALNPGSTSGWRWVSSGKSINYPLKFHPGQPDNTGGIEFCLNLTFHMSELLFNDAPCSREYQFICQMKC